MPADSQASVRMLDAKSKAQAVIVQPKKQQPPKPPQKSEVAVKVNFVKNKVNEAYYLAIVKLRSKPLVLLIGNIVLLIILLIGSYFDLFWWLNIGPEFPTTRKGLDLVYRSIRCGIAGSNLNYDLIRNVEPFYSMFKYVCERWIHEPRVKYQRVVLGFEKYLLEETSKDMRDIVQSPRLLSHGSTTLVKVAMLRRGCQDSNNSDLNYLMRLKKDYGLDG